MNNNKFNYEEKLIHSVNKNELIFKNNKIYVVINSMPDKYINSIIAYTQWSPKVVLGGSIALYLLQLIDIDYNNRVSDIDFSLTESFSKEELSQIINFFGLSPRLGNDYGAPGDVSKVDELLKEKLLLFSKNILNEKGEWIDGYNIDFFQESFLEKRDIIPIVLVHNNYEYDINLTQPPIILSYKARYALDTRVGKQYKHRTDIKPLFEDNDESKRYYYIMKKVNYTLQKNKVSFAL
jgi:hypothetical protein